jgi:Holliday junction resolvasome RuvABC endonuclease subunit
LTQIIRILGIDPSLRNTGLAVADYDIFTGKLNVFKVEIAQTANGNDGKVVRKSSDDLSRARAITTEIKRVIAIHSPNFAVAEVPGGTQSARGAFSNGVCCGLLACLSLPLIEVSPMEVKLASVGIKTASKNQMIQWAVAKWPNAGWFTRKLKGEIVMTNDNEHVADACAAIQAGLLTAQFAQAIAMMQAMQTMKGIAA